MSKISKNGLRSKRKMRRALERAVQAEIDDYLNNTYIDIVDDWNDNNWNDRSGPMFDRFGNGPSLVYEYLDPEWDEDLYDLDYDPIEYDTDYEGSCYDVYDRRYEDPYDDLDFYWHSFAGGKTGAVKSEFTLVMGIAGEPASWYQDCDGVTYMMVTMDGDLYLANSQTGELVYWGPKSKGYNSKGA